MVNTLPLQKGKRVREAEYSKTVAKLSWMLHRENEFQNASWFRVSLVKHD